MTGYWLHERAKQPPRAETAAQTSASDIALSDATKVVLGRLNSPVELRFYSLLDSATVSGAIKEFSGRVDALVSGYEREGRGKIKVTRFNTSSYANANAAARDGLKSFNGENGDPCFLGIALTLNGQRESLPQLAPEWEGALESDLTRALARLLDSARPAPLSAADSKTQEQAAQEVKTLIPDLNAVSVEDGTRILRESALKEFQALAKQAEAKTKEAQQKLADAQAGKSPAEQEAARQEMLRAQAEQMEKLKALAARSQAQIEAFQRLKAGGQ